jgi:hypothetical protein
MIDPNLTPEQLKEKDLFAKRRAEAGKPPKIEKGEARRQERERLIIGSMVENILGIIKHTELIMEQNFFLSFDVPLKDGRLMQMRLQANPNPPMDKSKATPEVTESSGDPLDNWMRRDTTQVHEI